MAQLARLNRIRRRRTLKVERLDERQLLAGLVADLNQIEGVAPDTTIGSQPQSIASLHGWVYFSADDGQHGRELFRTDGTASRTELVRDIVPGNVGSGPTELVRAGDAIYFVADDGAGPQLWRTDGTEMGTNPVGEVALKGGGNPRSLTAVGDDLYFVATADFTGTELWHTNGTSAGTYLVKDIVFGIRGSDPQGLTAVGDQLFFSANAGSGTELWVTDGSIDGTQLVRDIQQPGSSFPKSLVAIGNEVFFIADDGIHGEEIWKSDGTHDGTQLVRDIATGLGSLPADLQEVDGRLFFTATDRIIGRSLWVSDGSTDGTISLLELGPSGNETCSGSVSDGSMLFFTNNDGQHGCELWKSDGTEAGTQLVADLLEGDGGSRPTLLTHSDGLIYFSAETAEGKQLWQSNGTSQGTVRVDFDNEGAKDPQHLTDVNGTLFFVADDGVHGEELWTSNVREPMPVEFFELLAKDLAYRDWQLGDTIAPAQFGFSTQVTFRVAEVFEDGNPINTPGQGFNAIGLVSADADPILVLRGYESPNAVTDLFADFDPRGVGFQQFLRSRDAIGAWLNEASSQNQRPALVGHGLGGALTQLFASHYTEQKPDRALGDIYTFNSPGIASDFVERFASEYVRSVQHFVTDGDLVALTGSEFLPGEVTLARFTDAELLNKHMLPVLVDSVAVLNENNEVAGTRSRPTDVVFETFEDTEWLNSADFHHRDTDYLLWLAAARVTARDEAGWEAVAHLPSALLFRSTAEQVRESLADAWADLSAAVEPARNQLSCGDDDAFVEFNDISIETDALLALQAVAATFSCSADVGAKIQGEFGIPTLLDAVGELSDDTYLSPVNGGYELMGPISVGNATVVPTFFDLVAAELQIVDGQLAASGEFEWVDGGYRVPGSLAFDAEQWTSVQLNLASGEVPASLGPFDNLLLTRMEGVVSDVANLVPIEFTGDVGFAFGQPVDYNLPQSLGGSSTAKILEIDSDSTSGTERLIGAGQANLLGGLATGTGDLVFDWTGKHVSFAGELQLMNGLIDIADVGFRADEDLNISFLADATFDVPVDIPLIGGLEDLVGQTRFEYFNDQVQNDSVSAWSEFATLIGTLPLGYRIGLDGIQQIIGANELAASDVGEGESTTAASYAVPADQDWILLSAESESNVEPVELTLIDPLGNRLSWSNLEERSDIAVVESLSNTNRQVIMVSQPEAGIWRVEFDGETPPTGLALRAFVDQPTLAAEITSIRGGRLGTPVTITHNSSNTTEAKISFYFDDDNSGADGAPVAVDVESSEVVWDTSEVPEGTYHVYMVIDDGINPSAVDYFIEPLMITASGIRGVIFHDENGNNRLDEGDTRLPQVPVYLDLDGDSHFDVGEPKTFSLVDVPSTPGDEAGSYSFTNLAPGDYTVQAIPPRTFDVASNGGASVVLSEQDSLATKVNVELPFQPGLVAGVALVDRDGDGIRDKSEPRVSDAVVELWDTDRQELYEVMTTDGNGAYAFLSPPPGQYLVSFEHQGYAGFTIKDAGGTDDLDSDPDRSTGRTDVFTLKSGQSIINIDAGFKEGWQNLRNRLDVDADGRVSPVDVLLVINYINSHPDAPQLPQNQSPPPFVDVNGDRIVTPQDALIIINFLNDILSGEEPEQ